MSVNAPFYPRGWNTHEDETPPVNEAYTSILVYMHIWLAQMDLNMSSTTCYQSKQTHKQYFLVDSENGGCAKLEAIIDYV